MINKYLLATVIFIANIPAVLAAEEAELCSALQTVDFSTIQDAPTEIIASNLVATTEDLPAYCQVQGYIAPQVGFEIRLPADNWNGKFLQLGCGGGCGFVVVESCFDALHRGYACIASDMGHKGRGVWSYNNPQAEIDWGYRATHVTALAGKAITAQFYGRAPSKSYHMGNSTGGRQGMVAAQRFPWDFDGIIAGSSASDQSGSIMSRLWAALALWDQNGKPILNPAEFQLVHNAVVAECDMNDGVKDGVIGDPRICKFNPENLVCKGNSTTGCLSKAQARAMQRMYTGPTTSEGEAIFVDGAFMPGTELAFDDRFRVGRLQGFDANFLRYMAFVPDLGPGWQVTDLDFERDYKRFAMMESIYAANNPDLRKFKKNGGKLIIYHGWADTNIPPLKSVDYYETVEKTMGGPEATQDFVRLFMVPGKNHGNSGDGAWYIDYLSYLENWVEHGNAPGKMIGAHIELPDDRMEARHKLRFPLDPADVKFTRPVYPYPYPLRAKYKGVGDQNNAENFEPVGPD